MAQQPADRPSHYGGKTVQHKTPLFAVRYGRNTSLQLRVVTNITPTATTLAEFRLTGMLMRAFVATEVNDTGMTTDDAGLLVTVALPPAVVNSTDIWHGEMDLLHEDNELIVVPFHVRVRGTQSGVASSLDMLLDQLRVRLRDYPPENELLRAVDFDDVELLHACLMALNIWNEFPPSIGCVASLVNFPYLTNLADGALGYLYGIAAEHYARNRLSSSQIPTVAFDDKSKFTEYETRSRYYTDLWRKFAAKTKSTLAWQWQ